MTRAAGVSVVVLCHDYGRFLSESVHSVLGQEDGTVPLLEVVIIDDGSTDDTADVARHLAAQDPRVRVISHPAAQGAVAAANAGLDAARGTLLLILDADDRLGAGYLARCGHELEHTCADVAYGSVRRFGAEEQEFVAGPFDGDRERVENRVHKSALFRASLLDQGLRFDEGFRVLGQEDWVFWLDAMALGATFVAVPEVWLEYRRHEAGSRNTMSRRQAARVHLAIRRTRPEVVRPRHLLLRAHLSVSRNGGRWVADGGSDLATRAGGQVLGLLLQAVFFGLVARELNRGQFTAFVAVSAVLGLAAAASELGLQTTSTLRLLRSPGQRAATIGVTLSASVLVGVAVLALAVPLSIGAAGRSVGVVALVALAPAFLVRRVLLAYEGIAAGLRSWSSVSASRVITPLVAVVVFLVLQSASWRSWPVVGLSLVLGEVVGTVVLVRSVGLRLLLPSIRAIVTLLREAAPLGAIGALSLLHNRLDQPLIGLIGARADLTAYAVAYRPIDAVASVLGAMSTVVLARVVSKGSFGRATIHRSLLVAALAGTALLIAVVALRGPITAALGGAQAPRSVDYLVLLSPSLVLFSVLAVANQYVIAAGATRRLLHLVAVCTGANVLLNLALIPTIGAAGAGVSTVVTGVANAVGSIRLARAGAIETRPLSEGESARPHPQRATVPA